MKTMNIFRDLFLSILIFVAGLLTGYFVFNQPTNKEMQTLPAYIEQSKVKTDSIHLLIDERLAGYPNSITAADLKEVLHYMTEKLSE